MLNHSAFRKRNRFGLSLYEAARTLGVNPVISNAQKKFSSRLIRRVFQREKGPYLGEVMADERWKRLAEQQGVAYVTGTATKTAPQVVANKP